MYEAKPCRLRNEVDCCPHAFERPHRANYARPRLAQLPVQEAQPIVRGKFGERVEKAKPLMPRGLGDVNVRADVKPIVANRNDFDRLSKLTTRFLDFAIRAMALTDHDEGVICARCVHPVRFSKPLDRRQPFRSAGKINDAEHDNSTVDAPLRCTLRSV